MKQLLIGMLAAVMLLAVAISAGPGPGSAHASSPGTTLAPLLSCPDVDGSGGVDLFGDIFGVAFAFGTQPGDADYHPLFDVVGGGDGVDLFGDIFGVAFRFGDECPLVDSQVAKATVWGIANLPLHDNTAGKAALAALGYIQGSSDVPGQGVHYVRLQNWDGTFDPEAPEGLVYNNGDLAAQLYVVDGGVVGWGTHEASSCCPVTPHNVDLEGDTDGPQCTPACSWNGGNDGWHLHYFLCTAHVGLSSAIAIPGLSASACDSFTGSEPVCTIPVTVTPCYRWAMNVGWMGHLWNHQLNPNVIPDLGGPNGRFADCTPDGSGYKAFTCPS